MTRPEHLIAGAIVFSGGLLALVVHQGLKNLGAATMPPRVMSQQSAAPAPVAEAARPVSPPAKPDELARDRELRIEGQVTNALYAQKPEYMKQCFKNEKMRGTAPPGAQYAFTLTFDPQGRETSRKIEALMEFDEKRKHCITKQKLAPLSIPPLGEAKTVKVDFFLP